MESIRLALAIVAAQGWEVHQMDVKNAFLHGDLSEEIYMEQPHGFIQDSSLVCRQKKYLYGLKQTRELVLYVDDLLITGSSASAIATIKRALHDRFLMMDMGPLHLFLGLEISEDATGIKLCQAKNARDLLERFHITDCKPAPKKDGGDTPLVDSALYRQLVGSLLYLTHSKPDLSYAVGAVSRYMQELHELHWNAAKHILRYVQGTITFGIHYVAGTTLNLLGFTDSDWASDIIDHKSTSVFSLSLGSIPLCWSSKKQADIALSSVEAEYRGVFDITIQDLWLQHFLTEFGFQFHQPIVIWCDS
eukprot:PITA_06051